MTVEIDLSLTSRGLATNLHRLRETHMRLRAIKHGTTQQLIIKLLGDSFKAGDYWTPIFAKALQTEYGFAGSGWVGFGFFGTATAPPYVTGAAQPNFGGTPTVDGNVRPDLVAKPTFDGTWTSAGGGTNGYNRAASNMPSLSFAQSSTAGDRVRFAFPAGHTSARVFYWGNVGQAGSFRYSWDSGSTWTATISHTAGSDAASALLASVPAGAGTLMFEVISGQVNIAGVDMQSTAAGVRIHKLGSSGSATNTWAAAAPTTTYRNRQADLDAHLVIMGWGTNDQGASYNPSTTYTTQLTAILTAERAVNAYADILLATPPENQRVANAYPMSDYAAATRALAMTQKCAFIDHMPHWGDVPADYANGNAKRPWMSTDLIHPVPATGGPALANAYLEAVMGR